MPYLRRRVLVRAHGLPQDSLLVLPGRRPAGPWQAPRVLGQISGRKQRLCLLVDDRTRAVRVRRTRRALVDQEAGRWVSRAHLSRACLVSLTFFPAPYQTYPTGRSTAVRRESRLWRSRGACLCRQFPIRLDSLMPALLSLTSSSFSSLSSHTSSSAPQVSPSRGCKRRGRVSLSGTDLAAAAVGPVVRATGRSRSTTTCVCLSP